MPNSLFHSDPDRDAATDGAITVTLPVTATMDVRRVGRRVTGTIVLAQPNPSGRVRLTVDIAIPASWPAGTVESVIRVGVAWFGLIGKMHKLDSAAGKHIHARLRDDITAGWQIAAIQAYAASDWHRERRAWTTLGRFLASERLYEWIEKTPQYAQTVEREQQARAAKADLAKHERLAALNSVRHLPADQMHAALGLDHADGDRITADRDTRCRTIWQSLTPLQRDTVITRFQKQFARLGRDGPYDMSGDEFRAAVYAYVLGRYADHQRQGGRHEPNATATHAIG